MPESRYPKEIVLKDRVEVVLRPLAQEDHLGLCRFYNEVQASHRWYMKENPCSPETITKWIGNQNAGRAFSIVAVCDERIVAHAVLLIRPIGGRQHVGRLRVYVAKDFRRRQLGSWMLFDLIRYGMAKGLELIRCDFIVGVDDLAIRAAGKLDFVTEAVIKDYIKDEQGQYHDYQIMIKRLHKDWSDF